MTQNNQSADKKEFSAQQFLDARDTYDANKPDTLDAWQRCVDLAVIAGYEVQVHRGDIPSALLLKDGKVVAPVAKEANAEGPADPQAKPEGTGLADKGSAKA